MVDVRTMEMPKGATGCKFLKAYKETRTVKLTRIKVILNEETGEKEQRREDYWKDIDDLMVEYVPNPYDKYGVTTIKKRWADLVPSADTSTEPYLKNLVMARYLALKPHVEAYTNGTTFTREGGTPLTRIEGVDESVAMMLSTRYEIKSAEDLVACPDGRLRSIPHPDIKQFQKRAAQLLQVQAISTTAQNAVSADVAALKEENAALREMMLELMAKVSGNLPSEVADEPKRRGRPPKNADHAPNLEDISEAA